MTEPEKVEEGKYTKLFPELGALLGGYFHQEQFAGFDWDGHKKSYKPIVRYHKSIQSEDLIRKEIKELKEFLNLSKDWNEDELFEVLLNDFGGTFSAYRFNMTYREFLEGTLQILEEPPEKTKSEFIPKFIG